MAIDARQLPQHLLPEPGWGEGNWWNPSGYRSARVRARVMYVAMAVQAALVVATAVYYIVTFDRTIELFISTYSPRPGQLNFGLTPIDTPSIILGYLAFPIFIGVAIAQLAWLSRSVDNSWYLLGGTPNWSPGWSIGWWFIPGANLVMPFLVVNDLNRRMAKGTGRPLFGLLLTWWLSGFVLFGIFMVLIFTFAFEALLPTGPLPSDPTEFPVPSEAEVRNLYLVSIAAQAAGLIPLVLTFVVYRRIQRFAEQRERYALPPPPPTWYAPPPPPPGPWPPPAGGPWQGPPPPTGSWQSPPIQPPPPVPSSPPAGPEMPPGRDTPGA